MAMVPYTSCVGARFHTATRPTPSTAEGRKKPRSATPSARRAPGVPRARAWPRITPSTAIAAAAEEAIARLLYGADPSQPHTRPKPPPRAARIASDIQGRTDTHAARAHAAAA